MTTAKPCALDFGLKYSKMALRLSNIPEAGPAKGNQLVAKMRGTYQTTRKTEYTNNRQNIIKKQMGADLQHVVSFKFST